MNTIPPRPPAPPLPLPPPTSPLPDMPHTAQRIRLRANDYRPVPVMTGQKRPGLSGWTQICASATEADIRAWQFRHPDCESTGILCGDVVAVDIDCRTREVATQLASVVELVLGATPLHRVGAAPKVLLLYRAESPFRKAVTPKFKMPDGTEAQVEILAAGQQFVAFGTHPDTGQPYRWLGAAPEDVPAQALPVLRVEIISKLIGNCECVLEYNGGVRITQEKPQPPGAAAPKVPTDELIRRIQSDDSWHDNMLALTARYVAEGRSDEEILSMAPELTTGGYTADGTEDEMRVMIEGARAKGFDRSATTALALFANAPPLTDGAVMEPEDDGAVTGKKKPALRDLATLIMLRKNPVLWRNADGEAYATIDVSGTLQRHAIHTRSFRQIVQRCFGEATGRELTTGCVVPMALPDMALRDCLSALAARALGGEVRKPDVRACGDGDGGI